MSNRNKGARRRLRLNWGVIDVRYGEVMKRCRHRREAEKYVADWEKRCLGSSDQRPAVRGRKRKFERES